jgi:hypothetical protein
MNLAHEEVMIRADDQRRKPWCLAVPSPIPALFRAFGDKSSRLIHAHPRRHQVSQEGVRPH